MNLPQTGGCQCRALRYQITQASDVVYTCHCTDCQRVTGSAFSMALAVPAEAFHLTGVEPRLVRRVADSGNTVTRWLCPECGSWICDGDPKPVSALPGAHRLLRVRAGTLDDTSWLRPTVHVWTRSAQPWVVLPEDGQRYETQPTDSPTPRRAPG